MLIDIAERIHAQMRGLQAASALAEETASMVRAAEGSMADAQVLLDRMLEIAVQSANGAFEGGAGRKALNDEFQRLKADVNRIIDPIDVDEINARINAMAESAYFDALTPGPGAVWRI